MSSFRRPTNTNAGNASLYGGNDLHVITDMLNGTASGIPPVKLKTTNGVEFWDGILKFRNTADTFSLTIKNPTGLTANRNLTLPSVTVNDTVASLLAAQTFSNKTIDLADNVLTATSAVSGEIIVHNGTKFVRLSAGTSSQFLRGDGTWQLPPGAGGGEANTGSNVGTATGKVYKGMNGTVLEFKSVGGTSSKISTTNGTNDVTFDVVEANLTLGNLGGTLGVSKGGTGATTLTGILKGSGTSAITAVTAPSGAIVGDTDSQTLTNKTFNTTDNTLSATSIATGDILKSNGTKFVRMAKGTAGQVLKVNAGATDLEWATDETGGGGGGNSTTLFKNTTTVSVVSTAAETNVLNHSITGATIGINGMLHLIIAGWYLNNSGSDDQFDIRLKLGGTTILQDSSGTVTSSATRRPFYLEAWIKNINSASVQRTVGIVSHGNAAAGDVGFIDISTDEIRGNGPFHAESSINTGSTQAIVFSVDHADSSADISFNADVVFLELIAS